jgi:putative MATE family efflux protein
MSSPRAPGPVQGIWPLAWPAVLTNLLQALVGLVDVKVVGHLGAPAVAAVTTGHRVFFILQAVLMAVTTGTTALVARAWGRGDRDEAERVTVASLALGGSFALALTVPAVLFAAPLAGFFGLEPRAAALAATFLRVLAPFNVAFAAGFVVATALRAAGDTRTPLWLGVFTNVVNVALLYGLVLGHFGLPTLGVAGAALANGLAFTSGALLTLTLWWRGRLRIGVGPGGAVRAARVRRLLRIGAPAALEQVVWQGGFVAFLRLVALYGTAAFAAYGIGVNILAFSFVVGFGFQVAASTLVGQHLGAGDPEEAARSGWRATGLAVAVMLAFGTTIVVAARPIAEFLIDDPEVVRLTVIFIRILGSVQALMAIEFTLGGALRGAGDTRFPLYVVMAGLLGARVLLAALFAWQERGVTWIYGALVADYVVKASLMTWRFRSGRWRTALRDDEEPPPGRAV